MKRRTEVWTIPDFVAGKEPTRVEGGLSRDAKILLVKLAAAGLITSIIWEPVSAHAASSGAVAALAADGPVSTAFNSKIWPLLLDVGQPLAKTMMAIGIYKCIRNDVEAGWKMVYRSGIGLIGLYLIDGAIHILTGVGADLAKA